MDLPDFEVLPWEDFLAKFRTEWKAGQHMSLCATTGSGKTTFAMGLLQACRNWVLALDPKGGDATLMGTGWPRLPTWPPPAKVYEEMADGKPFRAIVGPVTRLSSERPKLRTVLQRALEGAFDDGDWTIYVDELQLLADRRIMNLMTEVETHLISARHKGLSIVTGYQRPANVPRSAGDQATWAAISYTRDRDVVDRLAEMMGRPKAEIRGAVGALPEYHWLIVGKNPRIPLMLTRPHPFAPVRR